MRMAARGTLDRSRNFAMITFCAKLPFVQDAANDRNPPFMMAF
ncbi:hypothetical protein Z949_3690 [Sulfitobacter guttiformis KCTC 32187]|nr:hypothetical protein Z949_3690 [Sulfitobacter guttiformis KCTC 32187]